MVSVSLCGALSVTYASDTGNMECVFGSDDVPKPEHRPCAKWLRWAYTAIRCNIRIFGVSLTIVHPIRITGT